MSETFNITPGGNVVVQGQPVILDGKLTGGSATGLKGINVFLNGITPGSWQSGDDFEFSPFVDTGASPPNMVTLNASFVGSGIFGTEVIATVLGVGNINLKLGEGNVVIDGGNVTSFGGSVDPNFSGLTTLTEQQSAGGFLTFGSASNPLFVLLTNINAQAATPANGGAGIDVNIDPSVFPTSAVTVNFKLNTVGNGPGTHTSDSDDYVHGSRDVFSVGYGASDGSATATTWNLSVSGKTFVELFTHGATNTTTVNISNGATASTGLTLFGVEDEFANVTTVKDSASGAQIITGALQTDGAFKDYTGFLADNTALPDGGTLTVTSTNSGNFVDLSGFESLGTATISVAAGTVVLSDDVLLSGNPIAIGTPTNIGYGGDDGHGPGADGTINWANLPSSANTLTFYHGVEDDTGTLSVVNTPNTFTMNLQDEDFHANNFVITALNTGQSTVLNLDLGSNAGTIGVLGATGDGPDGIFENWTVTGYGNINIHLTGHDDVNLADTEGFFASTTGGGVNITISGSLVDSEMHFGNVSGVGIHDFDTFDTLAAQAARGVSTGLGTITDTAKTFLELGATDATIIIATSAGGLDMEDPGTDISGPFVVTGSTGNFNNLQGTLGFVGSFNNGGGWFGIAGSATITGGATADHIWDTGGIETINVNNVHTKVFVDQFQLNSEENVAFAIASTFGDFNNNNGAGPMKVTINGFSPGASGQSGWVDFNTNSWGAFAPYVGLVSGAGEHISSEGSHFASFSVISGTGNTDNSDVVAYEIGNFGSASKVAASIVSAAGSFLTPHFGAGFTFDLLVAYANNSGGTNIADIQLHINTTGTTQGATIENDADLVTLSGVGLGKIIGSVLGSNDVVHFNGA